MKAEALYHLLMARARAIAPAGDGPGNAFLGEMRDTLAVTYGEKGYQLDWRWAGQPRSMSLAPNHFSFYVRGDLGRPLLQVNARADNWRLAGGVLRDMAGACGVGSTFSLDAVSTVHRSRPAPIGWLAGAAVAAGLLTMWRVDVAAGVVTAVAALAIGGLLIFQRQSHLREDVGAVNLALVTFAVALPGVMSRVSPVLPACLAVFLVMMCWIESQGTGSSPALWLLAGGAAAAPVAAAGQAGLAAPLVATLCVAAVSAVLPSRIRPGHAAIFVVAAIGAAGAASYWSLAPAAAALTPEDLRAGWAVAGAGALAAAVWWILGQQYLLFPWISLIVITLTAVAALLLPADRPVTGMLAFAGFLSSTLVRLVHAMVATRRARVL